MNISLKGGFILDCTWIPAAIFCLACGLAGCKTTTITWDPLYDRPTPIETVTTEQRRALRAGTSSIPSQSRSAPQPSKEEKQAATPATLSRETYGDFICTKDGRVYQGRIVKQDENTLFIAFPEGHFSIPRSQILDISDTPPTTPVQVKESP